MSEEEENKSIKEIKVDITTDNGNSSLSLLNRKQKRKNVSFKSKNYISEYPDITTPPPKNLI